LIIQIDAIIHIENSTFEGRHLLGTLPCCNAHKRQVEADLVDFVYHRFSRSPLFSLNWLAVAQDGALGAAVLFACRR
jgi:hypothetical protein